MNAAINHKRIRNFGLWLIQGCLVQAPLLAVLSASAPVALAAEDQTAQAPEQSARVADTRPSLVVLGVACDAKDKEWRDGLVGFGIQNWVAQSFYDSGQFRMFEEKPEVLNAFQPKLEETFAVAAKENRENLQQICKSLGADLIAVGQVGNFYTRPSGWTMGPVHTMQRDTFVQIELCLFDSRSGRITHQQAKGKVARSRSSFIADFGNKAMPFDPSTVGAATNEAVEQAVAKLVPGYAPRNRSPQLDTLSKPITLGILPLALKAEIAKLYPEVKSKRVALGIHNRIAKVVGATKNCRLQEIDPEVLEALELQWWVGTTGAPPAKEVINHTEKMAGKLDWIVYGEVFSFAVTDQEKLSGLSGKVNKQVTIGVQLRALHPFTSDAMSPTSGYVAACGIGRAVGDWESWKGDAAEMEQSFVGKAAGDAIAAAWPVLLHDLAAAPQAGPNPSLPVSGTSGLLDTQTEK